ncbi:MAG TPA: tetratricopeptide repeat protein [Blastocatellia bacterium]|nr:tetratricopeptide repeat protein [Blastocatellia bacterium]
MIFLNKKARTQRSAEKFVAQGKTAQAIAEYQKLVAQDPKDLMTINMLGDLYIKAGRVEDAVHNFTRIAEHYRENGYTVKAIAMYKKISKINPTDGDVAGKLAVLYSQQGLIVEARQQYLLIADMHARNNDIQGAFDIYQKIADLEPENTDIRIKLGELCLRVGQQRKAHDCFVAAGQELGRRGRFDDSLNSYLRALAADKTSRHALQAVSAIYVHIGEPMKAIDLLNRAFEDRPGDIELLTVLGKTYLAAEMLDEAEATLLSLVQMDPGKYDYLIELGRKFLQKDLYDRAAEQVDGVLDILINRRTEEKAVALLHEILKKDLNHLPSLERLVDIYTRTREMHNMLSTLDWLAEAAVRMGVKETAIKALRRLSDLDRHNEEYRRRLRDLGVDAGDADAIAIDQSKAEAKPAPQVEFQPAAGANQPADSASELTKELESIDFFIEQEFLEIAREALDRLSQRYPDDPKVKLRYDKLGQLVSSLGEKAPEFDTYGSSNAAPSFDPPVDVPMGSYSSAAEFDLIAPAQSEKEQPSHVQPDADPFANEFAFGKPVSVERSSSLQNGTESRVDDNVIKSLGNNDAQVMPDDIFAAIINESKQSTSPQAFDPASIEDPFLAGSFKDVQATDEAPTGFSLFTEPSSEAGHKQPASSEKVEKFTINEQSKPSTSASSSNSHEVDTRAEIFSKPSPIFSQVDDDRIELDLSGERPDHRPAPPIVSPADSMPVIDWGNTAESSEDDSFDSVIDSTLDALNGLGGAQASTAQLSTSKENAEADYTTEFLLDQSVLEVPGKSAPFGNSLEEKQMTVSNEKGQKVLECEMIDPISTHQGVLRIQDAGTSDLFDFNFEDEGQKSGVDAGLLEVFAEFRNSLTSEGPPDFETHYQLGIAYREMMLWDEALKEFQIAIKATDASDPTGRYLQCCNMLGQCFMGKNMPRPASLWFQKGLSSPNRSEEEYQALRYDLGLALEQQGDLNRAYEVFQEVCAVDLGYRSVDQKLEEIQSRLAS